MKNEELTPERILKTAKSLGLSFGVEGDQLIVSPKSKLNPTLAAAIQDHKFDLISLLALTSEEARKVLLRRVAGQNEYGNPPNARGDDNSPTPEQADSVRLVPDANPARKEAARVTAGDHPNYAGESPEPTPREARVDFAPAEPPVGVSVTAAAAAEPLSLDWVTATLEAKPRPPGDDFADRTCAPYIVRAARSSCSPPRTAGAPLHVLAPAR